MKRADRYPAWIALVLAAAAVFYAVFVARTSFSVDGVTFFTLRDDAMISMRYARNLAAGVGLVWNAAGPPVEGYTNFLWVLWMALLHTLPVTIAKVSLLVSATGAVVLLANVVVVAALAGRLSDRTGALVAAGLVAFYYPIAFWTLRGMEVGLLTLLVNGALWQQLIWWEERRRGALWRSAVLLAVAVLVRPDAMVPAIALIAVLWLNAAAAGSDARSKDGWWAGRVMAYAVVLTLLGHTLFRLWYYGDPLPNTYYLKVSGVTVADRVARGLPALILVIRTHLLLPLIVALYGLRRSRNVPLLTLWAVFLSCCAYSVYVGGDAWEFFRFANRYIAVAMPALFVLVGVSVSSLRSDLEDFTGKVKQRPFQVLLFGSMAALGVVALLQAADARFFGWYRLSQGLVAATCLAGVGVWFGGYWVGDSLRRMVGSLATVLVVVAVWTGSNIDPILGQWLPRAGAGVSADNHRARLGLLLERYTDPATTIAVTAAGNIPYFANRHTEDFLGKVDPVIARMAPREEFTPGHDRWDYEYSVGVLQPDLIVHLWSPTEVEYLYIATLGYRDLFGAADAVVSGGQCPGYMGAHGLACICQDGSFFSGMTCDLLVRDGAPGIDMVGIARDWRAAILAD